MWSRLGGVQECPTRSATKSNGWTFRPPGHVRYTMPTQCRSERECRPAQVAAWYARWPRVRVFIYIYNGVLGRAAPLLVRLAQELVQALGAQGVVCDRVEALEGCLEPSLSLLVICRAQQASASADASTSVDRATSRRRAKLASLADLVRVAGRCESSRENAHSPRSLLPTCAAQGACPPPAASVTLTLPRLLQVQATVPTLSHESCVFQGEDTSITIVGFGGV